MKSFNENMLYQALNLLEELLRLDKAPHSELVICGGSALIAAGLVRRTTSEVVYDS